MTWPCMPWASGQAAAFSQDGEMLALGDGSDIMLWNLESGKEPIKLEVGDLPWSMAFTPDGSRLLTGGNDKVQIWDAKKTRRIHSQEIRDSGTIKVIAVSPDNKHAAAAGRGDIIVFRLPGT